VPKSSIATRTPSSLADVAHQLGLGHLEDESPRRQPGVRQGLADVVDQARVLELAGGDVDPE
jgi:hypothetical protein